MNQVQMQTIEFQVPGLVDGITPAPAISFDPRSSLYKAADPDGIVRFTAAQMLALTGGNLGTFDPDFGTGGTFSDRFLQLIEVVSDGVAPSIGIAIVDADGLVQQEAVASGAEADFYDRDTILVPQGSVVAFTGYTATPGQPVVIRINVVQWETVEEYARLRAVTYCLGGTSPIVPGSWAASLLIGNLSVGGGTNNPTIATGDSLVAQTDNDANIGSVSLRFRSVVSRVSLAVAVLGAGVATMAFGPNSVGSLAGVANAVAATGVATVEIANPAAPELSGVSAHAIAQADVAGSIATASASGPGASVTGFVRAETAHTGLLRASGRGAHASGYVSASGYNATILASGLGAHAFGYSQSYNAAGYGSTTMQATERGSIAMGAVQYDGEISSTDWGSMARGAAVGGAFVQNSPGRILASSYGSFASGAAAGGTIEADGGGAHAMGRARRTLAGGGPIGQIRALGFGSFAGGNALSGLIEAGTVPGFADGSFAFGWVQQDVLGGTQSAIRASQFGSVAMGHCLGPNALLQAYNIGSFVLGTAQCSVVGGSARIETAADNVGNLAGGQAFAPGAFDAGILASNEGSFVWGQAVATTADASLSATGDGAWAGGEAHDATILASAGGSMAHGTVSGGRSITASAQGSFAHGQATSAIGGANILASGLGSVALGNADTGPITASASNSVQLGPGVNALADSVKIGVGGLQLFGIAATPGAPANGMIWVNAGSVYVRTNGVTKNLDAV